eukprot:7885252-Pyramimonas_sp.AAC.1
MKSWRLASGEAQGCRLINICPRGCLRASHASDPRRYDAGPIQELSPTGSICVQCRGPPDRMDPASNPRV